MSRCFHVDWSPLLRMFHPINRVATEDKYGSSVALEGETTDEEEKKAKQDEGEIFRLLQ